MFIYHFAEVKEPLQIYRQLLHYNEPNISPVYLSEVRRVRLFVSFMPQILAVSTKSRLKFTERGLTDVIYISNLIKNLLRITALDF